MNPSTGALVVSGVFLHQIDLQQVSIVSLYQIPGVHRVAMLITTCHCQVQYVQQPFLPLLEHAKLGLTHRDAESKKLPLQSLQLRVFQQKEEFLLPVCALKSFCQRRLLQQFQCDRRGQRSSKDRRLTLSHRRVFAHDAPHKLCFLIGYVQTSRARLDRAVQALQRSKR